MDVLLSHIKEEAQVASVLKEWLESSLDRDVHLSGESENFQFGKDQLAELDKALGAAQLVLLLCSDESISRPWVNFEFACAWLKRVPVIAACHCGCSSAQLPPPLGSFPAFDLTDAGLMYLNEERRVIWGAGVFDVYGSRKSFECASGWHSSANSRRPSRTR